MSIAIDETILAEMKARVRHYPDGDILDPREAALIASEAVIDERDKWQSSVDEVTAERDRTVADLEASLRAANAYIMELESRSGGPS